MPVHGPGPLSLSEVNVVFGEGTSTNVSMNDFKSDNWFVGDFSIPFQNFTTPGKYIFNLPGIPCTGSFEIASGGGGAGGSDTFLGHNGYNGSKMIGSYSFQANDILTIYVGGGGEAGQGLVGNAPGGVGGGTAPYAGGPGGDGGPTPFAGGGGGGGGATALLVNGVPVVVVGGGGGGGGGGKNSAGANVSALTYSTTTTGGAGGNHPTNGGGGGGGGGGNFGGSGGAVAIGDNGGSSGSPGGHIFGGWKLIYTDPITGEGKVTYQNDAGNFITSLSTENIINGGKKATATMVSNQTDGGDGYVKFNIVSNALVSGNFPTKNLKFSDFFNKDKTSPATTGTTLHDEVGTAYTFTVPVFANTFTITGWSAGGGGGSLYSAGGSGGDTYVTSPSSTLLFIKGGAGGGGGYGGNAIGKVLIGRGGAGGTIVTGKKVGSFKGNNGGTFSIEGNNSGGDAAQGFTGDGPTGGAGGAGGSTFPQVPNIPFGGVNGEAPGGGGGGSYLFKTGLTEVDDRVILGGGGGGGAVSVYGPVGPSEIAAGTVLTIFVGSGGAEGEAGVGGVSGGPGADGSILIEWN